MQINRLFEMVYLLMQRETVTARELAERFEVSTRTIYRDLDLLSSCGIPVYAAKGKGGGIRLLPDFVLNKSVLSEQEQREILFALQGMKATGRQEGSQVLSRLSALFHKDGTEWIDVDFSHWGGGREARDMFEVLKAGILEHRVVAFTYYSSYGLTTEREVEPMKLRFKSGSWYLQGYCLEKQGYRTFKILRMEGVSLTERYFTPREEAVPELENEEKDGKGWGGSGPFQQETIVLRFSERMSFRVRDEFSRKQIEKAEDGSLTVRITFPVDQWLYGYLLSFGDGMEVLSPDFVREELARRACGIAKIYQD